MASLSFILKVAGLMIATSAITEGGFLRYVPTEFFQMCCGIGNFISKACDTEILN